VNSQATAAETAAAFASDAPPASAAAAADEPPGAPAPASLIEVAGALWSDVQGAITERFKLLGLELRLAGMTLVQVLVMAVIVAVLVVTAWLGLMGGVVVGLMSVGLHWAIALGVGIAINLAVAAWLVRGMLQLIERVGMPASLRGFNKR